MNENPPPRVERPAGLLVSKLRNLPDRPEATPANPGAWAESWCGKTGCDPNTRMVWADEDLVTRCTCHPNYGASVGAAAGAR